MPASTGALPASVQDSPAGAASATFFQVAPFGEQLVDFLEGSPAGGQDPSAAEEQATVSEQFPEDVEGRERPGLPAQIVLMSGSTPSARPAAVLYIPAPSTWTLTAGSEPAAEGSQAQTELGALAPSPLRQTLPQPVESEVTPATPDALPPGLSPEPGSSQPAGSATVTLAPAGGIVSSLSPSAPALPVTPSPAQPPSQSAPPAQPEMGTGAVPRDEPSASLKVDHDGTVVQPPQSAGPRQGLSFAVRLSRESAPPAAPAAGPQGAAQGPADARAAAPGEAASEPATGEPDAEPAPSRRQEAKSQGQESTPPRHPGPGQPPLPAAEPTTSAPRSATPRAEAARPPAVPHVAEIPLPDQSRLSAPPAAASPVKEIALRLGRPADAAVDLQVRERDGRVHVAVRTADEALAGHLREHLDHLVERLGQQGYRAEAWAPPRTAVAGAAEAVRHDGEPVSNHREGGQGSRQDAREDGRQPNREDPPPGWLEELERSLDPRKLHQEETARWKQLLRP